MSSCEDSAIYWRQLSRPTTISPREPSLGGMAGGPGFQVSSIQHSWVSTQVPRRLTFLFDGPSRVFVVKENTIEFNHSSLEGRG